MTYQDEIREQLKHMSGWCDPAKGIAIADLIIKDKLERCLEIGVFAGKSLVCAAYGLRENGKGVIHGVDSWALSDNLVDTTPADADWWSNNVKLEEIYEECLRHISTTKLIPYVTLHRTSSIQAAKILDGPFDYLHIDGCHSEWSSTSDVTLWLPRVRTGGTVVMDDVNWESTQIAVRLVKKFCDLISIQSLPESCFGIFRKR